MPSILTLTDRAVCAFLISKSAGSSDNVFPFKRSGDKELPCIIVHSHKATPVRPYEPTFEVECAILIRANAPVDEPQGDDENTPRDLSDELVDSVLRALYAFGDGAQATDQLADAITEAIRSDFPNFTCQAAELVSQEQSVDYTHQMDAWTETINLKLLCCPSNVS